MLTYTPHEYLSDLGILNSKDLLDNLSLTKWSAIYDACLLKFLDDFIETSEYKKHIETELEHDLL